jgi:uncharacterized membrane protein (UPF0127 family)
VVTPHFLTPLLRKPEAAWRLVHEMSGHVLASCVHTAFDSASRREGLLKQAAWPAGSALVIAPCQAVHTVGMQFAIDVVFVDRQGRVLKVREGMRPWRMAAALTAFAVVELPAGSIGGTAQPGDTLSLVAEQAA